ncbi:BRD4-interacting chromatin-remodeling complex-associated protein-like isoform X1 [Xyrauchen texanus]|uniref:BRD4-interacting chromatin-remodeling complex-associated protein-like isoform X1 n=1 Tax=Xyrauchen texanus TaxID=154827 RepID=UPI002241C66C|nr:BRD4-interacting chromatin-remodeling complex-associated protein-like isoform X1 [Xyrauchen texanus]
MEDEDGTCLLDVLCDPKALNEFLHGTTELPSGELLINSSSGEPSLFTDTPSPASLADDANSQDISVSGSVDLTFLEEALLESPEGSVGPEEAQEAPNVQSVESQQKEFCDILQQSLQEADITEHTLTLETGLAQTAETFKLGLFDASLPLIAPYFSKPLTIPGLVSLTKDTQIAVEPPQPSLLAVGPGCPSLKPPGTQLMNQLPGNVFPTPSTETSFSLNTAQGSSMIIQKTLPSFVRCQMLASTVRTISPPGVMLQKTPLPIQPKLQVNIQPRLVQISPKPAGQKQLPGLTFIPTSSSPNVLSPSVRSKQSFPPQAGKPVSLHVVSQGGSIVIQPQGPFQSQSQFFLPSQTPETTIQSTSNPICLLSTPSNQVSNKPNEGHLVDSSHILTVYPRQMNFSPIFTSPTRQLTLKQGSVLSGSVPIQSTQPTAFKMPEELAGTYPSQVHGKHGSVVQSPTVGNQSKLLNNEINNTSILIPEMITTPILNGQPFVPPTQRAIARGSEGKLNLTQSSMLLLHERTTADGGKANEPLQMSRLHPPASVEAPIVENHSQPSPVSTLLQSTPNLTCTPQPVMSLSLQLITQREEHQFSEGKHNLLPHQNLTCNPQQHALKPSVTHESLEGTLLVQMDNHISPALADHTLTCLASSETFSHSLSECEDLPMPVYPGSEHSEVLMSPPIGQCSVKATGAAFITCSTTPVSQKQCLDPSMSMAVVVDPQSEEGSEKTNRPSSSSEELFVTLQQTHGLTELSGIPESTAQEYHQQRSESDRELTFTCVTTNSGNIFSDQHDLQEMVSRLHSQGTDTYTALQKNIEKPSAFVGEKEEKLTLAKRQHGVKQQLFLDHCAVHNPNTSVPFVSVEDAVRHLLPYHTCARSLPSQADFISVDKQFECISVLLLEQITDMLNKYRQLLLAGSQQESPSAEMVMLERLFLQSERHLLGEDRRRARRDPAESFLATWNKNSSQHSTVSTVQAGHFSGPSSPPSWALQSDRPPGLKTYRSSIYGYKRNFSGQVTNGGDMKGKGESLKLPLSNAQDIKNDLWPDQLPKVRLNPDMETSRTGSDLQNISDSVAKPNYVTPSVDDLLPEQCSPVLKRNKLAALEVDPPSLPALVDDGELCGHLQSALDSILELQRLQGSPVDEKQTTQQPNALDRAFSSMLEGQL